MPVLYRYWVDKGNTLKSTAPLYPLGNFSNQDLKDHALILDRVLALSVYILRVFVCGAVVGAVLVMWQTG
jgi:hypothetical protein